MTAKGKTRLLVVSNRLPVTIKKATLSDDDGDNNETATTTTPWIYSMSSGGLVSALAGLKKMMSFVWIGWPGFEVDETDRPQIESDLWEKHQCVPVYLSNSVADLYYNGFSNRTLWPLFHYLPGEIDFNEDHWQGYQEANEAFANTLIQHLQDGDMIWIQDYHLMLLPLFLRRLLHTNNSNNNNHHYEAKNEPKIPRVRIGFFLHTPFPSSEVYRVLPVRKEILLGVLQCDLVGFHTYDYARHFLSSCGRILDQPTLPNGMEWHGRFVHVDTFPIGIDPDKFINALNDPQVQENIADLQGRLLGGEESGRKLIIGIDRLDYIKGVPHKLHAFDLFLSRHPEWQGRVTLIQVAVPTRTEVEEYRNLRTSVNELVGRINSKYGTFDFTPVQYLYRSISFADLTALYRVANVCVVTSTRDGMNLVSYEYIATQKDKNGVLILSEFAGAAQSMNGAIIINPWNIDDIVRAYEEALTMPADVAARNHQNLFKYVTKHTASYWGQSFVTELQGLPITTITSGSGSSNDNSDKEPNTNDNRHGKITIENPTDLQLDEKPLVNILVVIEDWSKLQKLSQKIGKKSRSERIILYAYTPWTISSLDELQVSSKLGLIAESGSHVRHPQTTDWVDLWPELSMGREENNWQDRILPILQHYTTQTAGSTLEIGQRTIRWCFEDCEKEYGRWQAGTLVEALEKHLVHSPVTVKQSTYAVVVLPSAISMNAVQTKLEDDTHQILLVDHKSKTDSELYLQIGRKHYSFASLDSLLCCISL